MGCQRDIASAIITQESCYILALTGNQGNLFQQVENSFRFLKEKSVSEEIDAGHGRMERRICTVVNEVVYDRTKRTMGKIAITCADRSRTLYQIYRKTEYETRFYINSLLVDASLINQSTRSQWRV